jgi:MFS family permease|tara:strand:+ start:1336 stop:2619 length:1284 start_codon:yes stop_codon:yes gene_type:complete
MKYLKPDLYKGNSYKYYVLAVLTIVYSFNFIDRQLLVILQESIKEEMGLSDSQLGLLSGFSFAIFYVFCGIPLAKLADSWVRRDILAISITVWSGMTALSGFAQNFIHLLFARVGVAVGEAGGSPPAHAMISDIFSEERRATALAVYSMGINFGILFGFLLGGWINEYYGWRTAFLVVGLPGIAVAVLLRMTVAEPIRGMSQGLGDDQDTPKLSETLKLLWSRKSFRHLSLACAIHAFITYGAGNFLPSLFLRLHDIQSGELGTWLAIGAVFGGFGTFMGGFLSDHLGKRDKRWYQWIPALSTIITLPFTLFVYTSGSTYLALGTTFLTSIFFSAYLAPNLAITHSLVGLRMRAMSSAVLFFILNLIGLGLGPLFIGMVSDFLNPTLGDESIRYAMVFVIPVLTIWSTLHYLFAAKYIREDLMNAPN